LSPFKKEYTETLSFQVCQFKDASQAASRFERLSRSRLAEPEFDAWMAHELRVANRPDYWHKVAAVPHSVEVDVARRKKVAVGPFLAVVASQVA
jgi:hypothetical protein